MPRGYGLSLLLHVGLFLVIAFGFPIIFESKKEFTPQALTVEIVPIKQMTNLPQKKKPVRVDPPKPTPQPKKPVPKTRQEQPKPQPKKEAVPLPKEDAPKPEKKKPEPKKEEDKPKPKEPEDDFAVLMSKLKQDDTSDTKPDKKVEKPAEDSTKSKSDAPYDPKLPLSISEKDAIRSQFVKCWRMPAGSRNDYTLAVKVRVLVNPDGSVREVGLVPDQVSRYQSDRFFKAAADSAIRAVKICSPLQHLPVDKYDTWKDMELNFDPREMLY